MSGSRSVEDTYEAQNDHHLDELHSKLRTLRGVTTDIYDDVEMQNSSLDDTRNTFTSFGDSLAQSTRRAGQAFGLTPGGVKQCRLITYIVLAFLAVWFAWRVLWWWWPASTPPAQP